jgi:hypothetical protein
VSGGFFARWKQRRHCPHSNLNGIYGDAINHCGGFRLWCQDCGMYLDGPVALAKLRQEQL